MAFEQKEELITKLAEVAKVKSHINKERHWSSVALLGTANELKMQFRRTKKCSCRLYLLNARADGNVVVSLQFA